MKHWVIGFLLVVVLSAAAGEMDRQGEQMEREWIHDNYQAIRAAHARAESQQGLR